MTSFWRDESGQDLTEYALLLATVSLITAALVTGPMASVNSIWIAGNSELSTTAYSLTP
jgi:Flp pilus assembly pilin Flp